MLEFLDVDSSIIPDITKRYNEPLIARMVKPTQMLRRTGVWEVAKRLTPNRLRVAMRDTIFKPAGSVRMSPEDRALMLEFYRNDIHRLEEILGRELSAWLS